MEYNMTNLVTTLFTNNEKLQKRIAELEANADRITDEEKDRIFDQGYAKAKFEYKDYGSYLEGFKEGIEWLNGVLKK